MTSETATVYPGGSGEGPINTFPEHLEKEVGNMLMQHLTLETRDGSVRWIVKDLEGLLYGVLEFVSNK